MIATKTKPESKAARSRSKPVISSEIRRLQKNKKLSPAELGELARQLPEAKTKAEVARLRDAIMRGFYGTL
ncbi:MAG: hypothetical protein ACKVY0_28340 [Prosthecobacter sp.]|uniref:hypothetical protein n=1 Tax=Prosthecobacter sp. TaxID=1965333 RepID=UPI003900DCCD